MVFLKSVKIFFIVLSVTVIQKCFTTAQYDWSNDDQNIRIGGNAQSDWLDEDNRADHVTVDYLVSSRCHPNPCENNGFCHDTEGGISCTCAHGFLGHRCQG